MRRCKIVLSYDAIMWSPVVWLRGAGHYELLTMSDIVEHQNGLFILLR